MRFPKLPRRVLYPLVCSLVYMSSGTVTAGPQTSFVIDTERVHQEFEYGEADIDTVTLAPALHFSDWSIYLSVPWLHVEGSYFITERFPNLAYLCGQLGGLSPQAKLLLIRRGVITPAQLQYCSSQGNSAGQDQESSNEGIGDADLFFSYFLAPAGDHLSGSIGIGYKHDSGNVDKGLGTGTREAYTETQWTWSLQRIDINARLGYQWVVENDTPVDLDDYAYGSAGASLRALNWLTLGVEYQYWQANSDLLDDLDYIDWYITLGSHRGLSMRLGYTDYDDEPGYPQQQYSASISYGF